jgi:hypothetical protein
MLLSYKSIIKQAVLTNDLSVSLITVTGETQLEVDFQTEQDVRPEMLMQAKI